MSIEAIMPAAPVSTPSAPTTSSGAPAKPGLFAAVLGEEQAALDAAETKTAGDAEPQGEAEPEAADASAAAAVQGAALMAAAVAAPVPEAVAVATAADEDPTLALEAVSEPCSVGDTVQAAQTVAVLPEAASPAPETASQAAAVPAPATAVEQAGPAATTTAPASKAADEVPAEAPAATPEAAEAAPEKPVEAPVAKKAEAAQPSAQPAAADAPTDPAVAPKSDTATPLATAVRQAAATAEAVPLQATATAKADKPAVSAAAKAKPAVAAVESNAPAADTPAGEPIGPDAVQAATEPDTSTRVDKPQTPFARALASETGERSPKAAPAADGAPASSTPPAAAPGARAEAVRGAGVEAAQAAGSTTAAPTETPGDVAIRSIRYLAAQGEKQLTVRLHPESLGELVIEVTAHADGLDVQLTASRPAVRHMLEAQLGGLRDSLAREGVTVTQVTVTADLSGQNFQQAGGRHAGGEPAPQRSFPAQANGPYRSNPVSAAASMPRTSRHAGALDLYA